MAGLLGPDRPAAVARELTKRFEEVRRGTLADLAARLLARMRARGEMIATAESCTGGLLGSLLTDVEGASHAFERGFIVYSEEAKCELLGVRREGGRLRIEVHDTGPGIAESERVAIFDEFRRGDGACGQGLGQGHPHGTAARRIGPV